jgi:hypothetical protein
MRKRDPHIVQRQFIVIYRVFLLRVVDLELLSADGDVTKLLGQFAALLAAVSFMFTAPLILVGGRLPPEVLWTMEHLLIATTMAVIGLFSVFNWDSVFPDRQDLLVLAPLPVHPGTLFIAKIAALLSALGISIIALNVFTGLIWPCLFSPAEGRFWAGVRSLFAYWTTILAAGIFIFCVVVTVQGLTSLLLKRQYFLRLSVAIQVFSFALILGVYILEPSLETLPELAAGENQQLLSWLPTYWFLGLFQQLNGTMLAPFHALAIRAWEALVWVVAGAVSTVLFSYVHTLRKIVEEPDVVPGSKRTWCSLNFTDSIQDAVSFFSLRTLLRSRHHRVILSFYLGVGLAIVLAYVKIPFQPNGSIHKQAFEQTVVPYLLATILMMCVVVGGLRLVAALPIAASANWLFQLTELYSVRKYVSAVRQTFIILTVLPVCLGSSILFLWFWPFRIMIEHAFILGLIGTLLVELSLINFLKIPFTCAYLPGKGNLQYVFWACVLLFAPLVRLAAEFEVRTLNHPVAYGVTVLVLGACVACARLRGTTLAKHATGLRFTEINTPDIYALNLPRE